MLRTGWTRQELDSADPEDLARMIWVCDAERLAKIAARLDEATATPLPEASDDPASRRRRAEAMLDKADLVSTRDSIDEYLAPPDGD
jgi:hypothetical protein